MSLRGRLRTLEHRRGRCRGIPTVVLDWEEGQAPPAVPDDAPRCPGCGRVHALLIQEPVVDDPAPGPDA